MILRHDYVAHCVQMILSKVPLWQKVTSDINYLRKTLEELKKGDGGFFRDNLLLKEMNNSTAILRTYPNMTAGEIRTILIGELEKHLKKNTH